MRHLGGPGVGCLSCRECFGDDAAVNAHPNVVGHADGVKGLGEVICRPASLASVREAIRDSSGILGVSGQTADAPGELCHESGH
jgi:hypothetical protein